MKKQRILALLLAICLVAALFSACAAKTEKPTEKSDAPASETNKPAEDKPADTEPADTEPEAVDPEEITEINFYSFTSTGKIDGVEEVEAALNEITEREIGVHVNYNMTMIFEYMEKTGLAVASGEAIDVITRSFGALGLANMYASNQLLDISELLDTYGPEVKELTAPYMDAFKLNGGIYGLPPYRILNATQFIGFRKDILDDMGLTEKAQNMTSMSDFEEIMAAGKEKYADLYPFALYQTESCILGADKFSEATFFDNVGDTTSMIGGFDDDKIEALWFREEKVAEWKRLKKWADNGWIWPDAAVSDMFGSDIIREGLAFSEVFSSEVGAEVFKKSATGYDYLCVPVGNISIGSSQVTKFGVSICSTAEEPEAAMKFINLMYTSPEIMNLLIYGIEGKDYEVKDNVANYVNGDKDSYAYHIDDFIYGNQFLLHPWDGSSADFREVAHESFKAAPISPYLGFSLNSEPMVNQLGGLNSVNDQFGKQLLCGAYTDELYAEVKQKLEAAGINDYVAEVQKQVDAWRAAQ